MTLVSTFMAGIAFAAFGASSLFFARFWLASRDRFFLLFSIACQLLAVERLVLAFSTGAQASVPTPVSESYFWVYLIRLTAFIAIIVAIINKNRGRGR